MHHLLENRAVSNSYSTSFVKTVTAGFIVASLKNCGMANCSSCFIFAYFNLCGPSITCYVLSLKLSLSAHKYSHTFHKQSPARNHVSTKPLMRKNGATNEINETETTFSHMLPFQPGPSFHEHSKAHINFHPKMMKYGIFQRRFCCFTNGAPILHLLNGV